MKFTCYGHENVLSLHKNTVEFTKDSHLTKRGDCILAVKADFGLEECKTHSGRIRIKIKAGSFSDEILADINPGFSSSHEMVIRRSAFVDARTFAINATKAACEIDRRIVKLLTHPEQELAVEIEEI
jgi:uncharacterized protein